MKSILTKIMFSLIVAAAAAHAQSTWELPAGVEVGQVEPATFPEGTVGPITFAEAEFIDGTPIDGLAVGTLDGTPLPAPLSFGFSSADATIDGGPGDITFVQVPNIEGDANGTLSVDFGIDVSSTTFGFALSCGPPVVAGATAQALDGQDNPVGSPVTVDALDFGGGFAENQLTLSPGSAFRSIEVTFAGSTACPRFAWDNLVYDSAQGVPALSFWWLLGLTAMVLGGGLLTLVRR